MVHCLSNGLGKFRFNLIILSRLFSSNNCKNEDKIVFKDYITMVGSDVSHIEIIGDMHQSPFPLFQNSSSEPFAFSFILSTKSYRMGSLNQLHLETLYHKILCPDINYLSFFMNLPVGTSLHVTGLLKSCKRSLLMNSNYEVVLKSLKLITNDV